MNHHWAEQYASDRFRQLSQEARGDQLLRMAGRSPEVDPRLGRRGQGSWSGRFVRIRISSRTLAALTAVALVAALLMAHPG